MFTRLDYIPSAGLVADTRGGASAATATSSRQSNAALPFKLAIAVPSQGGLLLCSPNAARCFSYYVQDAAIRVRCPKTLIGCCLQPAHAEFRQTLSTDMQQDSMPVSFCILFSKKPMNNMPAMVGFETEREGAPILAPRKLVEIVR